MPTLWALGALFFIPVVLLVVLTFTHMAGSTDRTDDSAVPSTVVPAQPATVVPAKPAAPPQPCFPFQPC